MPYETVIGLEVHAQLLTRSKMFCSCSAAYANAAPNHNVCPVCLGMPGVLPVANRRAVEYTIMTGLALGCAIPEWTKWDRKNYPYPDLMKGYQISQYDAPLCRNGALHFVADGKDVRVGITRVHLEEDTARLTHRVDPATGESHSLVDVNRAGTPLMEIVSEPDMRSPEEARQYLIKLRNLLRYLGVCDGNMEEGSFRCDANVSIRPVGETTLGVKVEIKNMNSFRSVFRALQYEAQRQIALAERGERIVQETRGWVEDRGVTQAQRSKEHAHDYRYFPEPDLPPLVISRAWVQEIQARMPELPDAKAARYREELGLTPYQAALLVEERSTADYFEAALAASSGDPTTRAGALANWILNEVAKVLNARGLSLSVTPNEGSLPVRPAQLAALLDLIDSKVISDKLARQVFEIMIETGHDPAAIVKERGLSTVSDAGAIAAAIDAAIAAHPQALADYRAGKKTALTFFVGQVMKAMRGKADPGLTNQLLREKLDALVDS
ncbi:MAG: Asp-tRNA(Asn)/Glu-tRNA(Gln) amidotransferase subunit GatB [Dehalococcoidia bacterium]|nr:Asp-tRNA(Asn)/Glu-tRNA(Gln) amidotransferase subunit GatB [Dehalococcoidia bacterium]